MSIPSFDIAPTNPLLESPQRELASAESGFLADLQALDQDQLLRPLLAKHFRPALKVIYQREVAERTELEHALAGLFVPLAADELVDFFQIVTNAAALPPNGVALKTLVRLAERFDEPGWLGLLLRGLPLAELAVEQLERLASIQGPALRTLLEWLETGEWHDFPVAEQTLLLDLLCLVMPNAGPEEDTPDNLLHFVREVLPVFCECLATFFSREEVMGNPAAIADWYRCWGEHTFELDVDSVPTEYYQRDFITIVRFIPPHIWWNRGLQYNYGNRAFTLRSKEFYFLATGGSIRRLPKGPVYTRRMARVFVELDPRYDQSGYDMYYYCFARSLGAGDLLADNLRNYLRRPYQRSSIREQLERWNPLIQKLSDPAFEALTSLEAQQMLGYAQHMLRDQPDYNFRGLSVEDFYRRARDFYQRIQERALERERIRQERLAAQQVPEPPRSWTPLRKVEPREWRYNGRSKIRKRRLVEITSKEALRQESRRMYHCVDTYYNACIDGRCSIWTLRELRYDNQWHSLITIEVAPKAWAVVQARARFNATPEQEHEKLVMEWAEQFGLEYRPDF